MKDSLDIIIDAQLASGGRSGGVEQFIIALVSSLGKLSDGPEKYIIVTSPQDPEWLSPYLGPNQRVVSKPPSPSLKGHGSRREAVKKMMGPLKKPAQVLLRTSRKLISRDAREPGQGEVRAPKSDGFYESLGADVIHFPHQRYTDTGLPAVYNPHDLQHRRLPQFFSEGQMRYRDAVYQEGCRKAAAVASESTSTKNDLISEYGVHPDKIHVILWGAPTEFYPPPTDELLKKVREKYFLPETFAFYPAQTWPHKNHIRLLKALKLLHDEKGVQLSLICTGRRNDFWPEVEKQVRALGLEGQARFTGFIDKEDFRAMYRLSRFVVFPSMFEGGGFPVMEAFCEDTPVTCSDVASLPEYGGEAVLYFDPRSENSIADAMLKMTSDEALRRELVKRGRERARLFTWERTAMSYRALYRQAAGIPLSGHESELLGRQGAKEV